MGSERRRDWPGQERVLSPIILVLLAMAGVTAVVVLADGQPLKLGYLSLMTLAVASWGGNVVTGPLERFERWYANSSFLRHRLEQRSRRRAAMRKAEPAVRRFARLSLAALGASALAALAGAASGLLPAGSAAPTWMLAIRIGSHLLSYLALASGALALLLRSSIRSWDEQAMSSPRSLPIVTARELFEALSRPLPMATVQLAIFAGSLILLCLS